MRMASRVHVPRIISPSTCKGMDSLSDTCPIEPRRTKDMFKTPVRMAPRSTSKLVTPRATTSGISRYKLATSRATCSGIPTSKLATHRAPRTPTSGIKAFGLATPRGRATTSGIAASRPVPTIVISSPSKEVDSISKNLQLNSPQPSTTESANKLAVRVPTVSEMCEFMTKNLYSEPRRTKEMLQSPLQTKSRKFASPVSSSLYSEPRRTKEMLQSPLHRNALTALTTKRCENSKELLTPNLPEKSRTVRRTLQFNEHAQAKITERVVNYLKGTDAFQAIIKRGIQHLCVQDFKNIITHLLTFTGVPLNPLDKTNYIDITIQAMEQLGYPLKVRKSWLLIPSASLQHIMQIFDFLLDFVPIKEEQQEFLFDFQMESDKKLYVSIAKEYKTQQHKNAVFSEQELQSLGVNPLPPEQEAQIEELHEEQLESESESDDFEHLEQQMQQLRMEELRFQNELTETEKELESIKQNAAQHEQTMGKHCTELWRKGKELKDLKQQRDPSQIITYSQLLEVRNMRHNEMKVHCRQLNELLERTHNQLLILKRTRSYLLENVEAFNVFVRDLYYSSVLGKYCPSLLELPLSPTLEQIEERQQKLKELRRVLELIAMGKEYIEPLTEINSNVTV